MTAYYDSFILYSTAVSRLLRREGLKNITDGQKIANEMKNITLESPLGYPIDMDLNGDRIRTYAIRDLDLETGKFSVRQPYSRLINTIFLRNIDLVVCRTFFELTMMLTKRFGLGRSSGLIMTWVL